MKFQSLGSKNATGTANAVETGTTPFIQGKSLVAVLYSSDAAFAGAAKLQGSDDGTTYSDISGATITGAGPVFVNITNCPKYVQLNCTSRSAGTVNAGLLSE